MIQADSPAIGLEGLEPSMGDDGVRCYLAQPECLVQCGGVGNVTLWY